MQVTGEFLCRGTRDALWALLNDEKALAKCAPGCEKLVQEGPDEFAVTLKIGLAAIKGTYDGHLRITDKHEPDSMTLVIEAIGSGGFANVNGHMDLVDQGETTRIVYEWDVQVGGPVAMVGQRVLGGAAKWMIGEFFASAQKELNAREAG